MKNYFLLLAFLTNVWWAGRVCADGSYQDQYTSAVNRDDHKIVHGYYPYFFSDQARSRYSYSEKEKGVYQFGRPDKPWPFSRTPRKLEQIVIIESDGILYSSLPEHQRRLEEKLVLLRAETKKKVVVAQVNDTRDLEKIIAQHRWTWDSPAFEEAFTTDSDHLRTDLTDYEGLFQQK
ncbi:MAG: hypothetical protein AB7S78_12940 [Candidatus Omnitrophota bacterium]